MKDTLETRKVLFTITGTAPTDELGNRMIAQLFNVSIEEAGKIKRDFILSLCKPSKKTKVKKYTEEIKLLAICHQFIDVKVKDNLGVHIAGQNGNIETKESIKRKIESLIKLKQ